jgi:hypothetical protein
MKQLIIINGVTGAIGGSCLAQFSRDPNNTIYGLSRRALHYSAFFQSGTMPDATLICSAGEASSELPELLKKIDVSLYKRIIYIHALGIYPFEIHTDGTVMVKNDHDRDGIDDRVTHLTYDAFFMALSALQKKKIPAHALIFGGLADKYKPAVHQSWWKTINKVRKQCKRLVDEDGSLTITLLNISSTICPNELIDRPFVFCDTDANPRFWLMPNEIAEKVERLTSKKRCGFHECELFHPATYYRKGYYHDRRFTARKKRELGIQ